jgi:two-component system OmpR family sensor kinase
MSATPGQPSRPAATAGPAHPHAGFWRALRRLPERIPLRVKLITAVLALVVVALVVISVAGISVLRSYLLGQADSQLRAQARTAVGQVEQSLAFGRPDIAPGYAVGWIQSGGSYQPAVVPAVGYGPDTRLIPGPRVPADSSWLAANNGNYLTVPAKSGSRQWRILVFGYPGMPTASAPASGYVIVATDVSSVYATLGRLAAIDLIVSAAILVLLAIIGAAVVRASLRPLTDIERTAEAIAAGDLTSRVPDRDARTEVGRLGRSLNAMLAQIETAFDARARSEAAARRSEDKMRQFLADASHELRTPLTAIRGFAEYYRQRGGAGGRAKGDVDQIMRRVEQESSRMGVLVEDMLLLARLDQQRPLDRKPVDMLTLAADAVHDARMLAPGRSVELTVRSSDAALVIGDEVRLRQVIGNLMGNALTHTPDGTPISVRISSGSLPGPGGSGNGPDLPAGHSPASVPAVLLEVADTGPGLTPEQAEHAFERFYRADPARTRKAGGAGLGLAIVSALVAAHGGTVWVDSAPGKGATFGIALPLAPEVHAAE